MDNTKDVSHIQESNHDADMSYNVLVEDGPPEEVVEAT